MENSDSGDEGDETATQCSGQIDRLVREEDFYRFVNNLSEEDYKLMRDNDLLGNPGESTEEELLRRLQQFKENLPQSSEDNTGESNSSDDVLSADSLVNWLISFDQTENVTSGQMQHQSCREVNQVPEPPFTRPSGAEQNAFEVLIEVPPTRGERRARSRSPEHRRTRARIETWSPPHTVYEFLQIIQQSVPAPTSEELLVNDTERLSRTEHQETLREQITGLDLPNRGLFETSTARDTFQVESSLDITSEYESLVLRQISPTIAFNSEVEQVNPEAYSERVTIASRTQITSDTPITVTLEHEQGRRRHVSLQSEQADVNAYLSNIDFPTHSILNTDLNDIMSFGFENNLQHIMTDVSDSGNFMNSDSDLEPSLPCSSQNMEMAESTSGRDNSDGNRNFGSNSNPSSDYHSLSTLTSSAASNYLFSYNSSPLSSSSSSDESSNISSLMFERHDERTLSLGYSSESGQYSRSMSPVLFYENDPWASFAVDPFFILGNSHSQVTGLTKAQIDNLPIRYFGESETPKTCTICITEYTEGNRLRVLPCSHEYHVYCIDTWLANNSTCPICRSQIGDSGESENSD